MQLNREKDEMEITLPKSPSATDTLKRIFKYIFEGQTNTFEGRYLDLEDEIIILIHVGILIQI